MQQTIGDSAMRHDILLAEHRVNQVAVQSLKEPALQIVNLFVLSHHAEREVVVALHIAETIMLLHILLRDGIAELVKLVRAKAIGDIHPVGEWVVHLLGQINHTAIAERDGQKCCREHCGEQPQVEPLLAQHNTALALRQQVKVFV